MTDAVAICNLALQKLGSPTRITSLAQNTPAAIELNTCYAHMLDRELRANRWNFAKTRTTLAAHATEPDDESGFAYAFPLPTDCLRLLSYNESNLDDGRNDVDWKIENHEGVRCIMTSDGTSLHIAYIARITDATLYDPLFVDAFACRLAKQVAEAITQSNTKKADIDAEYKATIAEAKKTNAIENQPVNGPEDTWLSARR